MAFKKPTINEVISEIGEASIYIRSVKKWGKSTLVRDIGRVKYNDLSKVALIECGMECGDSMLKANTTHVDTYKDLMELKEYLITEKGKDHNIKIVAFDTADELIPIFEAEVVRLHNIENPQKRTKSIKAVYGGYNAGIDMAASMVKKYMSDLKKAGFGIIVIAHSKFKQIKEKGSLEEDGYMQLTSTLGASYESCFGDIFDFTLTGVIDRVYDEKGEKKYATDSIRKLYFRGTNLIDAGGRFTSGSVPEYLEFPNDMNPLDFAKLFVKTVEDGMKASELNPSETPTTSAPEPTEPVSEPEPTIEEESETSEELFDEPEITDDADDTLSKEDKLEAVKSACKGNADLRAKALKIIKDNGLKTINADIPDAVLDEIYSLI